MTRQIGKCAPAKGSAVWDCCSSSESLASSLPECRGTKLEPSNMSAAPLSLPAATAINFIHLHTCTATAYDSCTQHPIDLWYSLIINYDKNSIYINLLHITTVLEPCLQYKTFENYRTLSLASIPSDESAPQFQSICLELKQIYANIMQGI